MESQVRAFDGEVENELPQVSLLLPPSVPMLAGLVFAPIPTGEILLWMSR